jgi:hypothetical protein
VSNVAVNLNFVAKTYQCTGDRPSAPGMPHIQHLHSDVFQVSWDPSKNNGAEVELYLLEVKETSTNSNAPMAQQQRSSREAPNELEDNVGWTLLYNGSGKFTSIIPLILHR